MVIYGDWIFILTVKGRWSEISSLEFHIILTKHVSPPHVIFFLASEAQSVALKLCKNDCRVTHFLLNVCEVFVERLRSSGWSALMSRAERGPDREEVQLRAEC